MAHYRLGSICQIISGSTPKTGVQEYWNGDKKWITPAELSESDYIIYDTERKLTEAGVKSAGLTPLPKGTVILSSRAPIGKVAIAGCEMYCNQGFKNFVCSNIINNKYLYWYLRSKTDFLNSLGRGATFKEISKSTVADIELDIPELSEQSKRVAHLEKLQSIIASWRVQLAKLDELVKCRFVEMFGDPVANDKGWPIVRLDAIADIRIGPFGSLLHKEDYQSGNHALVNPSHIVEGKIKVDSTLSVSNDKYNELSAYWLNPGDIVMGRRGEMGRCAVVEHSGLICGTGSLIIRTHGQMKPYFLQNILSRPEYKKIIEDKAVGVTMMNLNVPIVSSLEVPLLPHEQQIEFLGFTHRIDKLRIIGKRGRQKA